MCCSEEQKCQGSLSTDLKKSFAIKVCTCINKVVFEGGIHHAEAHILSRSVHSSFFSRNDCKGSKAKSNINNSEAPTLLSLLNATSRNYGGHVCFQR